MPNIAPDTLELVALSLTPGLGPVRARRLLAHLGSPRAIFEASQRDLEMVEGIGPGVSSSVVKHRGKALDQAAKEIKKAEQIGARVVSQAGGQCGPGYPELLAPLPDAPLVLFVRGEITQQDRFALGIVGSRRCSPYGLEQSARFATQLSQRGITIISGGARGIDTAAHRGAVQAGGRTIVVLGCGLVHTYPPENLGLFDAIVEDGHGAIVSEMPCDSPPDARNFPARNRLISGMSLGVLVVEAGRKSGALITARQAVEDHGREVYALPGRVDSEMCEGSLELLKSGGAQLVTKPSDIIDGLEAPAWHAHGGTHAARYTPEGSEASLRPIAEPRTIPGGESGRLVFEACVEPRTPDQIGQVTGLEMPAIGQAVTMLEISGLVRRSGSRIERVR